MNRLRTEIGDTVDAYLAGGSVPDWLSSFPIVGYPDISVRLLNAYKSSNQESFGSFLALGTDRRLELRNYGRKTEAELRSLVEQLTQHGPPPTQPEASRQSNHELDRARFEALCGLERPWIGIGDDEWEQWCERARARASRQISDVAPVIGCSWPANALFVTIGTYLDKTLAEIWNTPRMGKVKMKTVVLTVAYLAHFDTEDDIETVDGILAHPVLKNLDARENLVLQRRLLVPERRQMTLDEAGHAQGVTRERIRQIEKNLLTRIRESKAGARILELLQVEKRDIFYRLSKGELFLSEPTLALTEEDFGGPHLLAIYLEGRSLRAWLDSQFRRCKRSWYSGTHEEWETLERRLKHWRSEQLPLPESVVAGSSNVTVREARAYFVCAERAFPFEGYLLPSAKAVYCRAARLHAFIDGEGWQGKDPQEASAAFGLSCGASSPNSHARSGYKAIVSTPSLFLASSAAVVPIHAGAPWRAVLDDAECDNDGTVPTAGTESVIFEALGSVGPASIASVIDATQRAESDAPPPGSIAAILTQSQSFVRQAPGLYDIRERAKSPERIEAGRRALMNEKDVRRYCFARHTGEDVASMFPLWDLEQEKRWAIRGREFLGSDTWSSLLAVAEPDRWPRETGEDQSEWRAWKVQGRWHLRVSWLDDLPSDVPSARDVLLVARIARARGSISWVRANLVLGATQINERVGMSAIVLCAILGLILPTGRNRWGLQPVSPLFDHEWINFENLLIADPDLTWSSSVFQSAFAKAHLRAASGDLGWIDASEVSVLRNLATNGKLSPVVAAPMAFDIGGEELDEIKI